MKERSETSEMGTRSVPATVITEDGERLKGRVVYSRGPIVRSLEIACIISSLLALAALGFTIYTLTQSYDRVQDAREKSAKDTCTILRTIIVKSAVTKHRLPVRDGNGQIIGRALLGAGNARQLALRFLRENGLTNCDVYASHVRHGISNTPQTR